METSSYLSALPHNDDQSRGQGLVEFALILPILLILLLGIIEFGYVFAAYSGLFNAAREATRYGAVHPTDVENMKSNARSKIFLTNPDDVGFIVRYDNGPNTSVFTDSSEIVLGKSRIVITLTHNLPTLTPFIRAMTESFPVGTQSARTVATLGDEGTLGTGVGGTVGEGTLGGGNDSDNDGVDDDSDICPGHDDTVDNDTDGIPDGCDACPGYDDTVDTDGDTVPDGCDVCAGSDDTLDIDGDGTPNGCDICPDHDDAIDTDGDSVPDGCDVCAGSDDAVDTDGDGIPDGCDNCPALPNADQTDADGDGVGDACESDGNIIIAKTPDQQRVARGHSASFTIEVTNGGETDLEEVTVVDQLVPECDSGNLGTLLAGESTSYTCIAPEVMEDFTNVAQVSATTPAGDPIADTDDALVDALDPIVITNVPLEEGGTLVEGTADEFEAIYIYDPEDSNISGDYIVGEDGTFSFTVPPLRPGHTIVVAGYDHWASAVVEGEFDPITIDPLCHNEATVSGTAQPYETINLSIPDLNYTANATVNADGTYAFTLSDITLQFGQTVSVEGYDQSQSATVEWCAQSDPVIALSPQCSAPDATVTINTSGAEWGTGNHREIHLFWDDADTGTVYSLGKNETTFSNLSFDINGPGDGSHIVRAELWAKSKGQYQPTGTFAEATFESPCPGPNLIVTHMELLTTTDVISTYQPLDFQVRVKNIGTRAVNSLFWTDLIAGEAEPLAPDSGEAWGAVETLGIEEEITLTVTCRNGLPYTGTYTLWGLTDSWAQIPEMYEDDNAHPPITVTVTGVGSEQTDPISGTGSIEGYAAVLSEDGTRSPAERARVWVTDEEGNEVASVYSAEDGHFLLENLPADTYLLMAETWINNERRYGILEEPITVSEGENLLIGWLVMN